MKNSYVFIFLIILSFLLSPFQSVQAALVPIEKASHKTNMVSKKSNIPFSKKRYRKKFNTKKRKQARKIKQENIYGFITAVVFGVGGFYLAIIITLLITGIVLVIPGLWIASIILFALPFIILLIAGIASSISDAKYEKKRKEALKKEAQNTYPSHSD